MDKRGNLPQANHHWCELCRLVGVRSHQADGLARWITMTQAEAHLNTNMTLHRQGTEWCSAFFVPTSHEQNLSHLGHPISLMYRWSHPASEEVKKICCGMSCGKFRYWPQTCFKQSHASAFRHTLKDLLSVPNLTCRISKTLESLILHLVSGGFAVSGILPVSHQRFVNVCVGGGWTLCTARKEWDDIRSRRQAETPEI